MLTESDVNFTIPVSYPWVPRKCEVCQIWGHDLKSCAKSSRKEDQVPKGNENQSVSVQGAKEDTMAAGQASPSTGQIPLIQTATDQVNTEQVNNVSKETEPEDDGSGWEIPKGRRSPRKTSSVNTIELNVTESPNTHSVLQVEDAEDGEIVVKETNDDANEVSLSQNSEAELDDDKVEKEEEVLSNHESSDEETGAPVQRNLKQNQQVGGTRGGTSGGTRGGRGRGRPRKNPNSQFDVTTAAKNKSVKASFGKH